MANLWAQNGQNHPLARRSPQNIVPGIFKGADSKKTTSGALKSPPALAISRETLKLAFSFLAFPGLISVSLDSALQANSFGADASELRASVDDAGIFHANSR